MSFPTHEHEISLHFFTSSLISFIRVLKFFLYRLYTYFVRFIPKYLIWEGSNVNGIVFCFFFNFIYLFYLWLCWVFVSVRGLSLVAASGGHSSLCCAGLSLSQPLPLWSTGSRHAGSVIVAHGPSCSAACGILPDQGSNPCPLHWQADSQPLRHQGSPGIVFLISNSICSLLVYRKAIDLCPATLL